jgi:hypothetical protein
MPLGGAQPAAKGFGIALPREHWLSHRDLRASYSALIAGGLPAHVVTRRWQIGRACMGHPICRAIVTANPRAIGFHDPYRLGRARVPLPPAHPACDCYEVYITDLSHVTKITFHHQLP